MLYIDKTMKKLLSVSLVACCLQFVPLSYAALKKINIDSGTCAFEIYHVSTDTPYEITWTGKKIPSYCKLSFISRGKEISDKYKVCAEVKQYNITDCSVYLKYYEGYSNNPVKSFSCAHKSPEEHCAPEDTYFDVEIKVPILYKETSSKVVVRMTSVQTKFDVASDIGGIIGYTILGLGAVIFIGSVCIVLVMRRRQGRTPGNVLHPPAPVQYPVQVPAQPNPYYTPPPAYDTLQPQPPQQQPQHLEPQGIQNPGFNDHNPIYERVNKGPSDVARPADFKQEEEEHYYSSIKDESSRTNPTAPAMDTSYEQNFQGPPT